MSGRRGLFAKALAEVLGEAVGDRRSAGDRLSAPARPAEGNPPPPADTKAPAKPAQGSH